MSHLIKVRVQDGDIKGVKIGNGVPAITHLQFADDSLFFCQANSRNCKAIKEAFEVYEYYSGQKINTAKSLITFGSRVHGTTQNRLKHILNIPNQGGGGKYLGLPEQFGRKKTEMFKYIVERVQQRTSSWSTKRLTTAGKEIMLKSVALSMPIYSMSCFKLPLGVVDEIDSILQKIWWEKSNSERGIPWIAWKRLQYSKKEGGLGFKNLSKFNDALLAKQAWRLLQYPDSLFARIMKARYYRDCSLLEATSRSNQSYGWSSILEGLNLLKQGVRSMIGDGNTTRLDVDKVTTEKPSKPIRSAKSNPCLFKDLMTKVGQRRFWNQDKILLQVHQQDQKFFQDMYLPIQETPDRLIWDYNKTGDYTVRSGYWLSMHNQDMEASQGPKPHGYVSLKNRIWKLKILPQVKHFLWRLMSKALPSITRLNTRGLNLDPICPICFKKDETMEHIMFSCFYAKKVWDLSNIPIDVFLTRNYDIEQIITAFLDMDHMNGMTDNSSLQPLWTMWHLWKSRNKFIFENRTVPPRILALRVKNDVHDWYLYNPQKSVSPLEQQNISISTWKRPRNTLIKCNYDAAYNKYTNQAT